MAGNSESPFFSDIGEILAASIENDLEEHGFYVSDNFSPRMNPYGDPFSQYDIDEPSTSAQKARLQASSTSYESITGEIGATGSTNLSRRKEAWRWYRDIPEIRELVNSSARLVARVRLQVGVRDNRGRSVALWDEDNTFNDECLEFGVTEEMAKRITDTWFGVRDMSGTQRSLQEMISKHWQIAGETIIGSWPIDGYGNPLNDPYGVLGEPFGRRYQAFPRFAVKREEVKVDGEIYFVWKAKLPPKGEWVELPGAEFFEFINTDPECTWEGSGWVMGSIPVCRVLYAARRALYAVARSQITAPPMLVPKQADVKQPVVVNQGSAQLPGPGTLSAGALSARELESKIGETVSRAMMDNESLEAVITRIIGMDGNWIDKVRILHELRREIDPQLRSVIEDQRRYLAENAEVPPEALSGFGQTNRWNGREVMEDGYRRWTWPVAQQIADMLLFVIVRPQLLASGVDASVVNRLVTFVDGRDAQPALDMQRLYADGLVAGAVGKRGFREFAQIPKSAAPTGPEDEMNSKSGNGTTRGLPSNKFDPNATAVMAASSFGVEEIEGEWLEVGHADQWPEVFRAASFIGLYRANAKLKNMAGKLEVDSPLRAKTKVFSAVNLHEHLGGEGVRGILQASGTTTIDRVEMYGQSVDYLAQELAQYEVDLAERPELVESLYDALDAQFLQDVENATVCRDKFIALVREVTA